MQRKLIITAGIIILIIIPLILFVLTRTRSLPNSQNNISLPTTTPAQAAIISNLTPTPFVPLTPAVNQGQADQNYSNQFNYINSTYPWYKNLPLQTKDYYVYFDFNKQQMFGDIYAKSNNLTPQQVSTYQDQIQSHLASFGVDLNKYPVQWTTNK